MPEFSDSSIAKLSTCDPRLQEIFYAVVQEFDCTVLEGFRDQHVQDEMYRTGKSQLVWPNSMHNSDPSRAVDVAPYPIDWNDRERFTYFAGYVKGVAIMLGHELRWGGDWDSDWHVQDNSFDDLPHFELVE